MTRRQEVGIELIAKDMATREVQRVGESLGALGGAADEAGRKTGLLGSLARNVFQGVFIGVGLKALDLAGRGFNMLGDLAIGQNAKLEQTRMAFTTLLGSAEAADSFIREMQRFAATTPFDFPGVANAARLFMAMGFEANEVIPNLTAVGDAVAALGGGSAEVNRVVMALGQMRAAGRVNAQDMMQLTSIGIPAWQMLADHLGVTVAEARKLSEQGLIPAEEGLRAILAGIENSNMGGAMAAQAKTFNGAMATITDNVGLAISGAFAPLFESVSRNAVAFADFTQTADFQTWAAMLRSAVSTVMGVLQTLMGIVGEVASVVLPALGSALSMVSDIVTSNWPVVSTVLAAAGGALGALVAANVIGGLVGLGQAMLGVIPKAIAMGTAIAVSLGPVGLVIAAIGAAVGLLALAWSNNFLGIRDVVARVAPVIQRLIAGVIEFFNTRVQPALRVLGQVASTVFNGIASAVRVAIGVVSAVVSGAVGFFNTVVMPVVRLLGETFRAVFEAIRIVVQAVMFGVRTAISPVVSFVNSTVMPVIRTLGRIVDSVFGGIGRAVSSAMGTVRSVIDGVVGFINSTVVPVFRTLGSIVGNVTGAVQGVANFLGSIQLPGFAAGAWKIPHDMVAVVHRGEMVVPADVAARLRGEAAIPRMPTFLPQGGVVSSPTLTQNFYFGPSSVRSREDIRDISREVAERSRLLGLGLTGARVGGIG